MYVRYVAVDMYIYIRILYDSQYGLHDCSYYIFVKERNVYTFM
jgi:hypothetical protein